MFKFLLPFFNQSIYEEKEIILDMQRIYRSSTDRKNDSDGVMNEFTVTQVVLGELIPLLDCVHRFESTQMLQEKCRHGLYLIYVFIVDAI